MLKQCIVLIPLVCYIQAHSLTAGHERSKKFEIVNKKNEDYAEFVIQPLTVRPEILHTHKDIKLDSTSGKHKIHDHDSIFGSGDHHKKKKCVNRAGFEDVEDCVEKIVHSSSKNGDDDRKLDLSSGFDHKISKHPDLTIYTGSGSHSIEDLVSGVVDKLHKKSKCKNSPNYEDDEDCIHLRNKRDIHDDIHDFLSGSGDGDYKKPLQLVHQIKNHLKSTIVHNLEKGKEVFGSIITQLRSKVPKIASLRNEKYSEKEDLDFGFAEENVAT